MKNIRPGVHEALGFDSLRGQQHAVIEQVIAGGDTVVPMLTDDVAPLLRPYNRD